MNWERIKHYSLRAGKEVLSLAEACYLTLMDSKISFRHKTLLIGALVYLLSPIDAVPDFLPGGFVDDYAVLLSALLATGNAGKHHLQNCRLKYGIGSKPKEEKLESIETSEKK